MKHHIKIKSGVALIAVISFSSSLLAYDMKDFLGGKKEKVEQKVESSPNNSPKIEDPTSSNVDISTTNSTWSNTSTATQNNNENIKNKEINQMIEDANKLSRQTETTQKQPSTFQNNQNIQEIKYTDTSKEQIQEIQDVQQIMNKAKAIFDSVPTTNFINPNEIIGLSLLDASLTQLAIEQHYKTTSQASYIQITTAIGCINSQKNPQLSQAANSILEKYTNGFGLMGLMKNTPVIGSNYTAQCS